MKQTIVTSQGEQLPRAKNQFTAYLYDQHLEKNLLPSATVPGQSMTVLEMVQRHRAGLPIDSTKGALYAGEEFIPDLSSMDLVDRANYMDSVADALVEVRARLEANAKTEKEKEFLAKVDSEVRKKLASINPKKPIEDNESTSDTGAF